MKIALLTTDSREHYRTYNLSTPYFGTAPEALLQGMACLPDIEVHVVCCLRQPVKSPEKLASNVFYHGLHVPRIGWLRTAYQGCIRATRKKLKEIRPDIVHGQGTEHDCALSAVFSGFPNVLTIHGNMRLIAQVNNSRQFSFFWLAARLETFTLPRSGGVVCITRYTQQAVSDLVRRTWVVPNAVDSAFFDIHPQPPPDAPPRILCVGLVCSRKNQNEFIRALDPLARNRKFEVLFLGGVTAGRPYDDEFLGLVQTRPWCKYGGFTDREQLKTHFRSTTLLALPSLEDNCPMVVLEAMAAGVPVVAARVGGVPELIAEGQTGTFCDPLDATSMMAGIERALADPSATRKMAAAAKLKAQEQYFPQAIARRHVEIYREVLSSDS